MNATYFCGNTPFECNVVIIVKGFGSNMVLPKTLVIGKTVNLFWG